MGTLDCVFDCLGSFLISAAKFNYSCTDSHCQLRKVKAAENFVKKQVTFLPKKWIPYNEKLEGG